MGLYGDRCKCGSESAPGFIPVPVNDNPCSGSVCDDSGDGPCGCDPCAACADPTMRMDAIRLHLDDASCTGSCPDDAEAHACGNGSNR